MSSTISRKEGGSCNVAPKHPCRAFSPFRDTDPLDRFRRVKSRLLKKKSKDGEKADASHLQEGKVGVASLFHLLLPEWFTSFPTVGAEMQELLKLEASSR